MIPVPLVLPPCSPSQLIDYVLDQQAHPTTVIICSNRSSFLSALLEDISPETAEPVLREEVVQTPQSTESEHKPSLHPLLVPTLLQLRNSRHVTTTFVGSISHLRAYLAIHPLPSTASATNAAPPVPPITSIDGAGVHESILMVYGLVDLHRDTSEWSAQGLGTTLASLIEAGATAGTSVMLVENATQKLDEDGPQDDVEMQHEGDEETEDQGEEQAGNERGIESTDEEEKPAEDKCKKLWQERLPMLSGSTRRTLDGEEGAIWAGRTVEVGVVLSRWFHFARDDFWHDKADVNM